MPRTLSRIILPLIIVMLLFLTPLAVRADGKNDAFTQTVNGYEIALVFAEHPAVGENQIHVQISDALDVPVANAEVKVSLASPEAEHEAAVEESSSHNNMPGMHTTEPATSPGASTHEELDAVQLAASHHEAGKYSGEVHIESSGGWVVTIHLTIEGESMEVNFPLLVKNGSRNGILAGFAGANILILIVAAVLKSTYAPKNL